ncbi:MAG TPA: GNAT family N-acetyltransferase [Thermodesulfobacteriota bacterium]|nr:GNAT family N-acetyltransferase [Thermodesulfobacteriota bacterium]
MTLIVRSLGIQDRGRIECILAEVKIFSSEEIKVALELIDSCLSGNPDYIIKVATDEKGTVLGYICYGKIPLTDAVWDIYWVVISDEFQGKGIAKKLLTFMEDDLKAKSARAVMVETSSRPEYEPARSFYMRNGFIEVSRISDFYAKYNDKVIYRKDLNSKN